MDSYIQLNESIIYVYILSSIFFCTKYSLTALVIVEYDFKRFDIGSICINLLYAFKKIPSSIECKKNILQSKADFSHLKENTMSFSFWF